MGLDKQQLITLKGEVCKQYRIHRNKFLAMFKFTEPFHFYFCGRKFGNRKRPYSVSRPFGVKNPEQQFVRYREISITHYSHRLKSKPVNGDMLSRQFFAIKL